MGTNVPNANAKLDITDSTKGIFIREQVKLIKKEHHIADKFAKINT